MYAIGKTLGKEDSVDVGKKISVGKLDVEDGSEVTLDFTFDVQPQENSTSGQAQQNSQQSGQQGGNSYYYYSYGNPFGGSYHN